VYRGTEDPDTCPGTYTNGQAVSEFDEHPGDGVAEFLTPFPDQCVSFYSVDDETGEASAPTQVVVHAPLPAETPTVGPITMLNQNYYPWREMQLGGAAPGNKVGYAVLAGGCPETAPEVPFWRIQLQGDTFSGGSLHYDPDAWHADYGYFPSAAAGVNCALFASLDWFGWQGADRVEQTMTHRHGPVVMREFVDEGPMPPTVQNAVWDAASETFTVDVSLEAKTIKAAYDPVDPSTCPTPGQQGVQEVYLQTWGEQSVRLTPPTPHTCVTFYVDAGEGPVPLSQGVPVDLLVPQG
jgi:hypothetical protein